MGSRGLRKCLERQATAALGTGEYLSAFPVVLRIWQGGLQREKGSGDDLLRVSVERSSQIR